jgi:inner membrane protein
MPTIFSHSISGLAISSLSEKKTSKIKYYSFVILSACIPDFDIIAFKFGIAYEDIFGHRGISHSILFALVYSFLVVKIFFAKDNFFKLGSIFFLITISHGLLDMFTNGGLGVCLACPFNSERLFFDLRPILVSPIGKHFFSERGLLVLQSEFFWIWIPSGVFYFLVKVTRYFWKQ